MQGIIISGKIGSGKSSLLRNKNFRKKFSFPQKVISTDVLAKKMYKTEISGYLFQKDVYLKRVLFYTSKGVFLKKNALRKYLFFSPEKTRKLYWEGVEKIVHPQVFDCIEEVYRKNYRKKGTLFIECAIPQKFPFSLYLKSVVVKNPRFSVISLLNMRNLFPREISEFLSRQK